MSHMNGNNMLQSQLKLKRIYEPALPEDGTRILIDRIWPRGVSKQIASIDRWMKDIAPSPSLRSWFGHRPERFDDFSQRYVQELECDPVRLQRADEIEELAASKMVTLVYAAKDPVNNHANVLHRWLLTRQ